MKSYKKKRMAELSEGVEGKNRLAGSIVVRQTQAITPVGTPETTGDPDYVVTHGLQRSIKAFDVSEDGVSIGTDRSYAPFVHNGTYDFNRGRGEFSEPEARELNSLFEHNAFEHSGLKGARPRPFLVLGLLNSRPFLRIIYSAQIQGGRP